MDATQLVVLMVVGVVHVIGVGVGAIPSVHFVLQPDVVLTVILPPLLYAAETGLSTTRRR